MAGPRLHQIDNIDRVPATHPDVPPWAHPVPPPRHAWALILAWGFVLIVASLLVWWQIGEDLRSWLRFGDGQWVGVWVPRLVVGGAVLAFLKSWLLQRQPGGFFAPWIRLGGTPIVEGILRTHEAHATRQFGQVAAYTLTEAAQAPQISTNITALPEEDVEEVTSLDPFDEALLNLPRLVDLEHIIDMQPGPYSVPFGVDHTGSPRWLDMRKDMLHVGIFGGSGAGKDNLLESWFVALTAQNPPDRVQFAVLDGKGHWMQPRMSKLAHMWLPPAGGIGDEGQRALQSALTAIQTEAARRGKLVFGADCNTMEQYCVKTATTMPYLVVMISDVMGNITGDVDKLLVDLVSKARALGMRIIVSMQTPTKQNMQWRTNLSTVLSGQMQGQSNDTPALGIAQADMLFPPSRLPEPKTRPGIFSVRSGQHQFLIQAALVRESYLARHIADLPVRQARVAVAASGQPSVTLHTSIPGEIIYPKWATTKNGKIAFLLQSGYSYRQVERVLGVSHETIGKVSTALKQRSAAQA